MQHLVSQYAYNWWYIIQYQTVLIIITPNFAFFSSRPESFLIMSWALSSMPKNSPRRASSTYVGLEQSFAPALMLHLQPDLTTAIRHCSAAKRLSSVVYIQYRTPQLGWYWTFPSLGEWQQPWVTCYTSYASRSRSVCSSATVSVGQHRYIYRRSVIQSAQMNIHHDFALLTMATWSCSTNTDRFGRRGFSASGQNQWNKLPPYIWKVSDKPEQFARALKTFLFSNSTDKHFWE